jgi:hypothetical protein
MAKPVIPPQSSRLSISASNPEELEGDTFTSAYNFVVTRSGGGNGPASYWYAVSGAQENDFAGGVRPSGLLTFGKNETSKVIQVFVAGDTVDEASEQFTVSLYSSSNSQIALATATATILDDDHFKYPISIVALDAVKAEGDAGSTAFTFLVSRDGGVEGDVTMGYFAYPGNVGLTGGDYSSNNIYQQGPLVIPDGQASTVLTINVAGDTIDEASEQFLVLLQNPSSNAQIVTDTARGLIRNDDTQNGDILAKYHFDEIYGSTVNDAAGPSFNEGEIINYSPDMRVEGVTIPPGVSYHGQALSFNGSNQYVSIPDSPEWNFGSGDFSIQFYASFQNSLSGTAGNPGDVLIGQDEGGGETSKWFVEAYTGNLGFHINSPTIGPQFIAETPFDPVPGQWYLIQLDKTGSTYQFSIDGNAGPASINSTPIPDVNAPLLIGQAEGYFFTGMIDDLTIL